MIQTSDNESQGILAHWGIDVSKAKLDCALLRAGKVRSKVFANNPAGFAQMLKWLQAQELQPNRVHVCMEATGPYSEASAVALADAGCVVSIVNPLRIKGYGQSELVRNKTDEVDAGLIARFCATISPEPWQAPSAQQRKLRALVERVQALQHNAQQERNRLESANESVKAGIEAHLAYLQQALAALKREIGKHIDGQPPLQQQAKLMQSINAVGPTTTAKVLAFAGDVTRFDSAKAFSAFIGVAPRQKRSGSSIKGRTTMGKGGSNALRHALFMPAMVAMKHNDVVKALVQRLQAKGMRGKQLLGAAMHKLAHLIYGVLKQGKPFDANWARKHTSENQEASQTATAPA